MSTTGTRHTSTTGTPATPLPQDPHHDSGRTRWSRNPVVISTVVLLTLAALVIAGVFYTTSRPVEPPQQPPAAAPVDPAARMAEAQKSFQEGYLPAETNAYKARDVGPLIGWASADLIDEMREQMADWRYADITAAGEVTATTEAVDYQQDAPEEGYDTVVLDVCTDTSAYTLTLPDGSDASRGPDGSADYLTRTQSTVTMVNNVAVGAERWQVVSFETDNATPC